MSTNEVLDVLNDIDSRIAAVALLHRRLSVEPQTANIDLNDYLRDLCATVSSSLAPVGQVELAHATSGICMIAADRVPTIAMIVTELLTNSIKYAHPTGTPGKVRVACRRGVDGLIVIEVADDGVGLPEGFDPEADGNLGLKSIRSLALRLQAELSFNSEPIGLSCTVRLPEASDRASG